MNNKDIEEIAIEYIKKNIRRTEIIAPYLTENDKGPFWDGYVQIHNSDKKINSDFIGRVEVQVKGKVSNNLKSDNIKHDVRIDDLKGYLKHTGVIYFVVLISADGEKNKIYYNALLPVKINQILNRTENTKTIRLGFKSFPTDNRDKINIFMDFYTNSQRQISFVNSEIPSLEDLKKQDNHLEIVYVLNAFGYAESRPELISSFLERELYMYAKRDGILQPLSDIGTLSSIGEEVNQTVNVNDKIYYSSFIRIHKKRETEIEIGNSLKLTIYEKEIPVTIKIKATPMLSDRIKDLEFLIDAFESGSLSIDDSKLRLDQSSLNLDNLKFSEMKEHFEYCCKIKRLFVELNIKEDLNLSILTEKEQQDLHYLISTFVDGQTIKFKNTNDNKYIYYKIQGITILIFANEEVNGSYEYQYLNIFGGRFAVSSADEGYEKFFYPSYSILKSEHYANISNINYDLMLTQYKYFNKDNPDIYNQANLDVLQMLLAYDICNKRVLLDTAIEILQWILETGEQEKIVKDIYQINYLQAIARKRELNEGEKEVLLRIYMDKQTDDGIKFAANVLLKQIPYAKVYFEKLESNLKDKIMEYPIFNLYSKLK